VTDEHLIAEAGRRLAAATGEGARVILFGSYARGEADASSDLDLLVIEPEVTTPRAESARLRRELRDLEVALDVIVVSRRQARRLGEVSGTMVNEAIQTGRVLVEG
jgi:predicted nucleotidyltransferase